MRRPKVNKDRDREDERDFFKKMTFEDTEKFLNKIRMTEDLEEEIFVEAPTLE
jgi:hypothetical protein